LFAKRIDEVLPEPQAALLNGMIFGIKGAMPKDFFGALKRTGVLHVIALSGMNISILINAVFGILTPFFGRRKACLLAVLLIIIFIWFVGPSASVVRAGVMGGLSLAAGYFGRQYWGVFSLIIAVGIMILVSPKVVGDIGFQLSVAATVGIMIFATQKSTRNLGPRTKNIKKDTPGVSQIGHLGKLGRLNSPPIGSKIKRNSFLRKFLKEMKEGTVNNLRVTLAAQIFTLPIILANFGELSIISPLTNVLIAPLVPYITSWGLLAAILVALIKPLGILLLWCLWVLLSYFVVVVKLTNLIPFASVNVPKIGWWMGGLYYLLILFLYFRKKIKIKM